jgi:cob(I)alamin adenosyltransferase
MPEDRTDPLSPPDETRATSGGRKVPRPKKKHSTVGRVPPRAQRHGLVIVNTGDGKGKTTAALGILLRAAGRDMTVGMFQFIKSADAGYGEVQAAKRLGVEIVSLGDGFTWLTENIEDDRALARLGWDRCRGALAGGRFDVLIFDEMTYPLTFGWLDTDEVLAALAARPAGTHVVITGRNAPDALVAAADLVTEMRVVKHPHQDRGLGAQPGIEM